MAAHPRGQPGLVRQLRGVDQRALCLKAWLEHGINLRAGFFA